MHKHSKRKRYYTLMIVPHDVWGRTISLKIPVTLIYTLSALMVFCFMLVASSLVYSSHVSRRLAHYASALAKNQEQQEVIESFTNKTKEMEDAILEIVREDNYIRKLLGLNRWRTKIKLASSLKEDEFEKIADDISHDLKLADADLEERKKSLQELKEWVNQVRQRYASTPSRWPIRGRIVSYFGNRIYPWRGFHSGIDLSGMYGAPIRSTGDGVVSYAGWIKGYGKTVIVNHEHGISTWYAHTSRCSVTTGQKVRKGEVICYVGNTGYTTGPHLHYEVRKWGQPVNPVAYLDLNILTASKIWSK